MKTSNNIYKTLFVFLNPFWKAIFLAILLGFLTIAASIGLMTTSSYIIAAAALHPSLGSLMLPITGVRFFGISRAVFRYFERIFSHNTTFKILSQIRVWFYKRIEPLAPARLQQYQSGDLISRIIADVETLDHFYVNVVAPPLVAIFIAFAMSLFLSFYSLKLSLIFLIFFILAGFFAPLFARSLSKGLGKKIIKTRSHLNISLIDGIQGLADLIGYGRIKSHKQKLDKLNKELTFTNLKMSWIKALNNGLQVLIANWSVVAILIVTIPLVYSGQVNGIFLAVVSLGTLAAFEATLNLPVAFQYLEKTNEAAKRLFEIVEVEPMIKEPHKSEEISRYDIKVDSLFFRYPSSSQDILKNISFSVEQREKIAIVGASGAGKSTIINLLMRFWDYQIGSIKIGGVEIKNINSDDIKKYFAVVSQNTYLFNTTIKENLLMANPKATEKELFSALEKAKLQDFVRSLPDGLNTFVGDQGMRLSGGERQRLAIARALLKNAPILILDEATANLDAITEWEIIETIFDVMQNKTTLMITHRLIGMDRMDKIYVLSAGEIIEQGKHNDLIVKGGNYAQMWALQQEVLDFL